MISDAGDLAEYILTNYRNKVVEVGVGNLPHVALLLKDRLDVIVTDITPDLSSDASHKYAGLKFYRDDIFNPDLEIYKNASLVYSIRPPIDIQEAIASTAKEVGADLLIRPFSNEKADLGRFYKNYQLMNYRKAKFYLCKVLIC